MPLNMKIYVTNLALWAKGIRWLWTRRWEPVDGAAKPTSPYWITYKPGYGPWRFLPIYLTTYLLGTLAGFGVQSLSGAWGERGQERLISEWRTGRVENGRFVANPTQTIDAGPAHPHSRRLARAVDWVFEHIFRQGPGHCANVGGRLWGSRSVWE